MWGSSIPRPKSPVPQGIDPFAEWLLPGSYPEHTKGPGSLLLGEKSAKDVGGGFRTPPGVQIVQSSHDLVRAVDGVRVRSFS